MIAQWPTSAGRAGWAVLQLVECNEVITEVDADICRLLPGAVVHFPAVRYWRLDGSNPLALYAFVLGSVTDTQLLQLRTSRYVASVLMSSDGRKVARVTDAEVGDMVQVAPGPTLMPGDTVRIIAGDWVGLTASVVAARGDRVLVRVTLESCEPEFEVPLSDLLPEGALQPTV
jgi:hypothetical protein